MALSFDEWYKKKKKEEKEAESFDAWYERKYGKLTETETNSALEWRNDEIAPVSYGNSTKGGSKNSIFKSGGFSDGVDGIGDFFGDLGETVLGTVGDLGLSVAKGAGRLVEGLVDLGMYGIAGAADLLGADDDDVEAIKEGARTSYIDKWTQGAVDYVDQYSALGNKADMVGEGLGQVASIILTGGLGAASGLGTVGTTALTTGVMGLSGVGSGMGEAYAGGATDEEAWKYGLTKGAIEAGSELLFGGLGKASKAIGIGKSAIPLDDLLARAATKKITSQTAKNLVQYGIKASAEGVEEVVAGYLTAHAKKGIYMPEKDFSEILDDENLLESFIVGAVTSGIAQSGLVPSMKRGSLIEANKEGRDFITGYTQSEQSVIDKEVENRIAEQEKGGKKLTKKEIAKIEELVQQDMEKGRISTDTIEETLGGETYKQYKSASDQRESLVNKKAELEKELAELKKAPNTIGNAKLYDSIDADIKDIDAKIKNLDKYPVISNLKKQLVKETLAQVKDSRLIESYNEVARKGKKIEIDLSQYKSEYAKKTAENAIRYGFNNTNEAHDFLNLATRLAEDKNYEVNFVTTQGIKESVKNGNPYGIDADPKKIQAFVSEKRRQILVNMDSKKSLNSLVGHEITDTFRETDGYEKLQKFAFAYAETKGEYKNRLDSVKRRYANLNADIKGELTSDIVGDYLFSDYDFVKQLSVEHRNIFQKIYDEIKYMYKLATAGSKEARQLEQLKHQFEKVWRESGSTNADVKFSIREEAPPKETGIAYKVFFVKDGKLYPPMVANPDGADTPMGVWLNADVGTAAPPSKTGRAQVKAGGKGTQGGSGSLAFRPGWHLGDLPRASQFDRVNPETGKKELFPENFVWAEVEYAKDVDYQEEAMSYGYTENGKFRHAYAGLPKLPENGYYRYRTNPKPDTVPWVITGAMKVNRLLSDAEVNEILEKNGVPAVHRQGGDVGLDKFGFDEGGKPTNKSGVEYDKESQSYSPVKYSLGSWNESDYVSERQKAAKDMAKALSVTEEKATKYIDDVNSIAKMIADDKTRLAYEPSPNRSAFVSNAEYGGSIDFSTICKKRRLFTGTFEAIQNALPNTALTAEEVLEIRKMMKDKGYEVSCGLCYVEGSRANMGQYTKQFIERYRATNPEYVPNMAEMNTATGQEQIRKEHPEVYEAYEYFMNHYGRLSPTDKALFASQQKPKMYQMATEYKGEVLDNFDKKKDAVDEKNRNGGLRLQSFSDFEVIHLIDSMQVIMDMSRVGLAGQAYTKVPDFAWALGDTGLKINLSLIAKGVDENGRLVLDEVEGMKESDAMALRDRYSDNVGTILVTFNDEQLKAAMADERIDYIIPYHRSQWKTDQYEAMGLPENTKDYTNLQNESYIEPVYNKNGKKQRPPNYMPNRYWKFNKSGKENAEDYLRMCAEDNRKPKFSHLLVDNQDGSYSLQPDGSTDGYWKTLIDFKMYNNDGIGVPQNPVTPDFNMEEAKRMLNEYTGGHSKFPVAQDIVDEFVSKHPDNIAPTDVKYSVSEDSQKADADYLKAVESGDTETAQKMVDEAAKKAGYRVKGHHGTDVKFTVFNREQTSTANDFGQGFYFSSSQVEAERYQSDDTFGDTYTKIYGIAENNAFERIHDMGEDANDDALFTKIFNEEFDKELKRRTDEGAVISAYLKMDKPFIVSTSNWITEEEAIDIAKNTMYVEDVPNDAAIADWIHSIKTYAKQHNGKIDTDHFANKMGHAINLTSALLHQGKYDGILDYSIGEKFNSTSDYHAIALYPNQIKSSDPVTYDDNGNVIPLSERFNEKNEDIRYSLSEDSEGIVPIGDYGYHAGDLGKAEGYWNMTSSNRGTGHFGTGTYFVGDEAKISDGTYGNRPHEKVDFSKYKLYRPILESEGFELHESLKYINDNISLYPIASMSFNEIYDTCKQAEDAEWTLYWDDNATEAEKGEAQKTLNELKERFEIIGYDPENWGADKLKDELNGIRDDYRHTMMRLTSLFSYKKSNGFLSFEETENRLNSILQSIYDETSKIEDAYNARYEDSPSTRFMKAMGYEGIDVRLHKGLDNVAYGSVIYDLKGDDLARKQEIGTAKYSLSEDGEGDKLSNKEYGNFNVYADDIKLQDIAPTRMDIPKSALVAKNTMVDDAPMLENIPVLPDEQLEQGTHTAIKPKPTKQPSLKKVEGVENTPNIAKVLTEAPKVEKKKGSILSKAIANFVDKGAVFENLSLKTKNRALQDTYKAIGRSGSKAQYFMENGTKGVKSLDAIRTEVEKTGHTAAFYEYLYHKHNVDRMSLESKEQPNLQRLTGEMEKLKLLNLQENQLRAIASEKITKETSPKREHLIKTVREYLASLDVKNKPVFGFSVTAEMSQKIVDEYESLRPDFKEYAQDVYDYMNYLRKMMVYNGIISQETAELWSEMYPNYVPIHRVGDEGLGVNVPLDTNRTGINAPIKRATGGNTDILPLFDTMAQRTMQTFKAIDKNNFGIELKDTLGGTVESTKTSLDDVIDSIDAQDGLLQEGKNGKNPTFTVFEGGDRVTFEITDEMYDALKPTSEGLSTIVKPLNAASNFHRGVLTEYNPTFMVTNAIKDAQDVLINSQHPAKTYANFPLAIKELTTNGKWFAEYMQNGGGDNTYFDKQTNTFNKEKSTLRKVIGFPFDKISDANNFIEKIPRLAEYIASRKNGASIDGAMLDAARVTTDFSAGGDITKFLNRNGATFLNASVQGFAQQVRNVREAKTNGLKGWVQLATKYTIAGLPAILLNSLLWDDDEDYEELSDYVKDNYYVVAKYGDGKFVRIPKGRASAVIQDGIEQIGNTLTGNPDTDWNNFFELFMSNLAPNNPLDNNIIAPIKQVMENKTWYGEDLVPTRLQDLPASEQFDESTDSISKWLGENLNVSPYKINYLLNQYSGGIGDVVLPMLTPEAESGDNSLLGNVLAPMKDKFTTDSVMNNQNVSDFYTTKDELAINANGSNATDEDVLKYKYFNSANAELSKLYKLKREVQNSDLPDDRKYEKVRDIQDEINATARESLNSYNDVYVEDGYAVVGDKEFKLNKSGEWQKITDEQAEKQADVSEELGISASDYWSDKSEYDFAYKYPNKYAVAKAVGGYDAYKSYSSELYDIKADKDASGKSISGSRKEKVIAYINNLDADYYEKIILFKSEYPSSDTYNGEIIEYINNREDLSFDEKVKIFTELGFTVQNGSVYWD